MNETHLKQDARVGLRLGGRYLIEHRLDSGGMAVVYQATDEILGRSVAVKIMHPALAADGTFAERFRGEAQNAARLSHPNICTVYDYGETPQDATPFGGQTTSDRGDLYIVMELVEGSTLRSLLERFGHLDVPTSRHVARGVAAALDHAHSKGIIHRDVKPENVLLTPDGQVKVVDFGIAKALGAQAARLTIDRPIGTVAYVAPEQITATNVDGRADVYALGAMTFEMLTGRAPFSGDSPQAVAAARLRDPQLHAGISPQIDAAVAKATAADPERRYDTPGAFAYALGEGSTPSFLVATDHLPTPPPMTQPFASAAPAPAPAVAPPPPPPPPSQEPAPVARYEDVDVLPFRMRLRHRKRRRFRVYIALFVLLAIGAAAAYVVMPRPTVVPDDLKGQPLEAAKTLLRREGLLVGDVNEVFHDVAGEGTVVGSDPDPGTAVKDGAKVTLLVSKGAQLFEVPDIVGKQIDEAKTLMQQAGFSLVIESESHHDSVPKGAVVSHDPDRESAKRGTSFSVVVSKGPPLVAIPTTAGKTAAQARAAITGAGFLYGERGEFSETAKEGIVITSEPGSGMAPKGSTVTAVVSKGPRPFPMPNLVGLTRGAAKGKATNLGLVIRNEYPVPGSGKAKGTVQGQNPPAGTSVRKGAAVDIYYSN